MSFLSGFFLGVVTAFVALIVFTAYIAARRGHTVDHDGEIK